MYIDWLLLISPNKIHLRRACSCLKVDWKLNSPKCSEIRNLLKVLCNWKVLSKSPVVIDMLRTEHEQDLLNLHLASTTISQGTTSIQAMAKVVKSPKNGGA